jgi:small subunit ribosomal protein S6
MFILDSGQYGRDPQGVSEQIPHMIRDTGGEVLASRLWEERRLAYPIKGQRKGTYWLTYFQMDGGRVSELTRKCRLSHSILRHLFVKVDPRIVETLVEHAKSGQAASRAKEQPSAKGDKGEEGGKDDKPTEDTPQRKGGSQ